MYKLPQKMLAEFIGTFALVFIGAGSICADQMLRTGTQRSIGLLGIALAQGLAMGIMISALGHISGGHLNPAITIGFWVTRRLDTLATFGYWISQLSGAILAAYLLRWLLPEAAWRPVALGAPDLATDLTRARGITIEGVLAFFLVLVVFGTLVDSRGHLHKIGGLTIGLTLAVDILIGAPFTGASVNPARALGPALVAHHWLNHGVYWIGPLAGGILAAWIYDSLLLGYDSRVV